MAKKQQKNREYFDEPDKLPFSQRMLGKTVLVMRGVDSWYGEVLEVPAWDWFVVGRGDFKDTVSIFDIRNPAHNV